MTATERVAQAMYEDRDVRQGYDYGPFADLPPINKQQYMDLAKAAIIAVYTEIRGSEFRRGPSGGHGERPEPSIENMFDAAFAGLQEPE